MGSLFFSLCLALERPGLAGFFLFGAGDKKKTAIFSIMVIVFLTMGTSEQPWTTMRFKVWLVS